MRLRATGPRANTIILMGLVLRRKDPHPNPRDSQSHAFWFKLSRVERLPAGLPSTATIALHIS